MLLISGFKEKLPESFKVHHKNTEDQVADISIKSLAWRLFELFNKEGVSILSFFCMSRCTVLQGGQLQNRISPISLQDCVRTWIFEISHSKA
jgi:hypothetical protein